MSMPLTHAHVRLWLILGMNRGRESATGTNSATRRTTRLSFGLETVLCCGNRRTYVYIECPISFASNPLRSL
jgi:hypothetical protein